VELGIAIPSWHLSLWKISQWLLSPLSKSNCVSIWNWMKFINQRRYFKRREEKSFLEFVINICHWRQRDTEYNEWNEHIFVHDYWFCSWTAAIKRLWSLIFIIFTIFSYYYLERKKIFCIREVSLKNG
jgi:hypothetical protein